MRLNQCFDLCNGEKDRHTTVIISGYSSSKSPITSSDTCKWKFFFNTRCNRIMNHRGNSSNITDERTAVLPEPRGPRSNTELLHASVIELETINFSLLHSRKTPSFSNHSTFRPSSRRNYKGSSESARQGLEPQREGHHRAIFCRVRAESVSGSPHRKT